jgi:sugar lactone lactonase YvrE
VKIIVMNKNLLVALSVASLSWVVAPVVADDEPSQSTAETPSITSKAPHLAGVTKQVWVRGLNAPHGLVLGEDGSVWATEYKGGQVAQVSADGKTIRRYGKDLQGPAWITRIGKTVYVSERKANRVLRLEKNGTFAPFGPTIDEPIGLAADARGNLLVVSHGTSNVLSLDAKGKATPVYVPSGGKHYGYRSVILDRDGSFLMTDETDNSIVLATRGGRVSNWVTNLNDPTGIALSPRGEVFVLEEGSGRVAMLNAFGAPTVVAEGLGKPRGIVFLNDTTFLVSDQQDGVIWRITLPKS